MKYAPKAKERSRGYHQVARAEATQVRHEKIVRSFMDLLRDRWLDEFTLNDVAEAAGVTVQTLIRKFGGKEGLLKAALALIEVEVMQRREAPKGDVKRLVSQLVDDYEVVGDMVIRCLAQEPRFPMLTQLLSVGRKDHRAWLTDVFASQIKDLPPKARKERVDALYAATDVYIWKLFRRDFGYDTATTKALVLQLVLALLENTTHKNAKRGSWP
jgi:AcrR family transcriptional regulator